MALRLIPLVVVLALAACRGMPARPTNIRGTQIVDKKPAGATMFAATPKATHPPAITPHPPSSTATPGEEPTPSVHYNAPGDYVIQVTSGVQNRSFKLHIPPSYHPRAQAPLVINLHGRGSNASEQEFVSQMSAKADEEGFIVVYPQALGAPPTWYPGPGSQGIGDVVFLRDLISFLEERLRIDPDRIYATGFSNGGMAERLGCLLADRFAAIASVSGTYVSWESCRPVRPLPVVAFHGTNDEIVPYAGGEVLPPIADWAAAWAERNGCDLISTLTYPQDTVASETWSNCESDASVVLYSIDRGGHHWPGGGVMQLLDSDDKRIVATDIIWEFFKAHRLP